ncbi:MAG: hypothetical protein HGA53_10390 [Anaerolineaceae bacterium]|nr:hypothetical protein [Anaerolineaceae bacterium]
MRNRLAQAYQQAPWRLQLQTIMMIMVALVIALVVAGIYLSVSAQAANAGIEIRMFESDKENLQQQIANLQAKLGEVSSAKVMLPKAKELGFTEANQEDKVFIIVPGYAGRQPITIAPPPGQQAGQIAMIRPEYRQSIWDWLFEGYLEPPGTKGLGQP